MKRIFKLSTLLIIAIILLACSKKVKSKNIDTLDLDIENGVYLRNDLRDNNNLNLKFITNGKYELKTNEKNDTEEISNINKTGLDNLNISVSAQFSEKQFKDIAKQIKEVAGNKEVYIIDLREESHGFLDGIPTSWYKYNNVINNELKIDDILLNEKQVLSETNNKYVTLYSIESNKFTGESEYFKVKKAKTEEEIVNGEGFNYLRFPCAEYTWIGFNKIKSFIEFLRTKNLDNIWLHFHCDNGIDRSGIFFAIYDMIKNPDISLEDIMNREYMLGFKNLLKVEIDNAEVGNAEVGNVEADGTEVGSTEVDSAEVGSIEVGGAEVDSEKISVLETKENILKIYDSFQKLKILKDDMLDEILDIELDGLVLNDKLLSDMAQVDLNFTAKELYELWDVKLNDLWDRIKEKNSKSAQDKLTKEERQWVRDKEKKVASEGKKYEGGSMRPLIEYTEAARITRDRTYVLAKYLQDLLEK